MGNHGRFQTRIKEEGWSLPRIIKFRHEPTMSIDHYVGNHSTVFGTVDASALADNQDQGADEKFATGQQQQQLRYQKPKTATPKTRIKIATWNVRTGYQVGYRQVIVSELLRYGISIAPLTELRLTGFR